MTGGSCVIFDFEYFLKFNEFILINFIKFFYHFHQVNFITFLIH
jgi:hypothetical protein